MTLSGIKGLGPKRLEALAAAGITDRESLLTFFPTQYFVADPSLRADRERSHCGIACTVVADASSRWVKNGLNIATVRCADNFGDPFTVTFFNRPYAHTLYKAGARMWAFGDLTKKGKTLSFLNPIFERADEVTAGAVYTVYPTVAGIPRKALKAAIAQCLGTPPVSVLTAAQIRSRELEDLATSVRMLHEPPLGTDLAPYARTCAVEETVQLFVTYRLIKNNSDRRRRTRYTASPDAVRRELAEKFPHPLTADQKKAIDELFADMTSPERMNRLLQGDVGSGKTVVAFAAMRLAALSGVQCALMAPTEVLAAQHCRTYSALFGPERVCYLAGGLTAKEKALARARIASGEALVVIGTHSLFQESVSYADLGLVVTDEQHRFGVGQRSAIEDKGRTDVLIMSATPIPRTMALLLYGELDVSRIREKPAGRRPVTTRVVPMHKVDDMYAYVRDCAARDLRTYIVVPRVEDEDEAVGVKQIHAALSAGALKGVPTGLLYGTMAEKDKQRALAAFAAGETKVLVSTTVIEVGVDVPQACNMIVLDAERFGLAQLHQLRGRVGRGSTQSFCFLLSREAGEAALARFDVLKNCNDGFELADCDLRERGAGDFLGSRQHGGAGSLSALTVSKETIDTARDLAEELLTTVEPEALLDVLRDRYRAMVKDVTLN